MLPVGNFSKSDLKTSLFCLRHSQDSFQDKLWLQGSSVIWLLSQHLYFLSSTEGMKRVQCKCSSILLLGAHSVHYSSNNYTVSVHISTPLHTPCTETTCYITFSPPKHLLPNTDCSPRFGHKLDTSVMCSSKFFLSCSIQGLPQYTMHVISTTSP